MFDDEDYEPDFDLESCARCGSSLSWEHCDRCDDGYDGHECGDDCCACLHPEENVICDVCNGKGGWYLCHSSQEFCETHPLPGREQVKRHTTEREYLERKTRTTNDNSDPASTKT
jgi:hypothetical protein